MATDRNGVICIDLSDTSVALDKATTAALTDAVVRRWTSGRNSGSIKLVTHQSHDRRTKEYERLYVTPTEAADPGSLEALLRSEAQGVISGYNLRSRHK